MEIIGYVDNSDLDASMSVLPADKPFTGQFRILAQVNHRYPLTHVNAIADIYRGHKKIASIPLSYDHFWCMTKKRERCTLLADFRQSTPNNKEHHHDKSYCYPIQ
jgi:hypothetical protein